MTGEVKLRHTRKINARVFVRLPLMYIVLPPVSGVMSVASGEDTFLVGVLIGLSILTFFSIWALLSLYRTGYRVRGATLIVRGLRRRHIDFAQVQRAAPRIWKQWGGHNRYLALEIDSLRIILGLEGFSPCYYRPEGLRALAEGLEQSPDPDIRANGRWLRDLADQPDLSAWPMRPEDRDASR